jgi:hypothetical protein
LKVGAKNPVPQRPVAMDSFWKTVDEEIGIYAPGCSERKPILGSPEAFVLR